MTSWHAYPSIYNLGHKAVEHLLSLPHYIEEKVDGSQFSFGVFPVKTLVADGHHGHYGFEMESLDLRVRSKGAVMFPDAPEKMFTKAVETAKALKDQLTPGWTYRGEFLRTPSHNTLVYNRIPAMHIILFDISTGDGEMLSPEDVRKEAARLGLETVPILHTDPTGSQTTYDLMRELLAKESILGGQRIEGVVVKQLGPHGPTPSPYVYGPDKKLLMGKFVSEAFKEIHSKAWKEANPTKGDVIEKIIEGLATPARWGKAAQHLREAGKLENSPRDIGKLIKEAQEDILREAEAEIRETLWKFAKPHIMRGCVRGLPEWYKEDLLKKQFEQ